MPLLGTIVTTMNGSDARRLRPMRIDSAGVPLPPVSTDVVDIYLSIYLSIHPCVCVCVPVLSTATFPLLLLLLLLPFPKLDSTMCAFVYSL